MSPIQFLKVISTDSTGALLESISEGPVYLSKTESFGRVEVGDQVIVYVELDDQGNVHATEKFESILTEKNKTFKEKQIVELLIYSKSDLGYKAIIDKTGTGILYRNEVFEELTYGQLIKGYVKKIREDGKIDLLLRPPEHFATEDISLKIIELLQDHKGFYHLTDKTSPEEIYKLFGVSKKKYKIALGQLYKKRIISVSDEGIKLV